jgi:hypothetical protein
MRCAFFLLRAFVVQKKLLTHLWASPSSHGFTLSAFAEISKNWAGQPLISYEKIMNYIRTTKTKTGLCVGAGLIRKQYDTGEKISKL